ncbi:MAG: ATP-binding cassette domain-containing protein [Anaerolineae bacterium]
MTVAAIQTEQLSKQFTLPRGWANLLRPGRWRRADAADSVVAVDGITLTVNQGELYGLLGPNGAGKTTLIRLLCTMVVPSSGRGSIFGIDLSQSNQIRQQIGMASGDERSFYWRLSGRHNLEFFGALCGLDEQQARQRAGELLEKVRPGQSRRSSLSHLLQRAEAAPEHRPGPAAPPAPALPGRANAQPGPDGDHAPA